MHKYLKMLSSVVLCLTLTITNLYVVDAAKPIKTTNSSKTTRAVNSDKTKVWSGKTDVSWYTGEKKIYDISTPEQLAGIADIIKDQEDEQELSGVTINLTADIVLNDVSSWEKWDEENAPKNKWNPIGYHMSTGKGTRPFIANFNGNGHTISGLYVNAEDVGRDAGLFCCISGAVIKDLNIEKSVVIDTRGNNPASRCCGALTAVAENAYFYNCNADNVRIDANGPAGGLVGKATRIMALDYAIPVALLAMGIAVNPVFFEGKKGSGVFFDNCHVTNSGIYTKGMVSKPPAAGIVGKYRLPGGGLIDCSSENNKAGSVDASTRKMKSVDAGNCGAIIGDIENECEGKVTVQNCSVSGFEQIYPNTKQYDKELLGEKKKK